MKTKLEKQTRKTKDEKLRGEARKLLLNAHPETMRIAINLAHGVARDIVCPHCEGKFDIKVGDGAKIAVLTELIQQVVGKPKQPIEGELTHKIELNNSELLELNYRLEEFRKEKAKVENIEVVEAEFKALPVPELPAETTAPPAPPIAASAPELKPSEPKPVPVEVPDQYKVKE